MRANEQKTRENASIKVKNAKDQAKAEVDAIKEKYKKMSTAVSVREKSVENREKLVSQKESDIDSEISNKAAEIVDGQIKDLRKQYDNRRRKLNNGYRMLRARYKSLLSLSLFYGLFTTFIMAASSESLKMDVYEIFRGICKASGDLGNYLDDIGREIISLATGINNNFWGSIAGLAMMIMVIAAFLAIIVILICFPLMDCLLYIRKNQFDEVTAFAVLVIIAITVFMAERIKSFLGVNCILLGFGAFALYSLGRYVTQKKSRSVL